MNKQPVYYWAMILSACSMGEAVADFLSHGPMQLGYALASVILVIGVVIALYAQMKARARGGVRYWFAIIMMATAGTTIADYLSRTLALGYFWGTVLLAVVFAATFLFWRRGSASKPVDESTGLPATDGRYWTAIMVASTLGTTLGDALTNGTRLGFGGGTLLLGLLLAIVFVLDYRRGARSEVRYWAALILASTIGATSGDYVTKEEGLSLGYYWGIGLIIAVFLVVALVHSGRSRARGDELRKT